MPDDAIVWAPPEMAVLEHEASATGIGDPWDTLALTRFTAILAADTSDLVGVDTPNPDVTQGTVVLVLVLVDGLVLVGAVLGSELEVRWGGSEELDGTGEFVALGETVVVVAEGTVSSGDTVQHGDSAAFGVLAKSSTVESKYAHVARTLSVAGDPTQAAGNPIP
jgi:hypothetical protein